MVALADVRRWDPAAVEDVFRRVGTARDRLVDLDYDLRTSRPPPGWTGTAATAATTEHNRLAEQLRRITAGVAALRPALADAADAITVLRRDLDDIDRAAATGEFAIATDGTVTDVRTTPIPAGDLPTYQARRTTEMAQIVAALEGVLRRAHTLDTTLADLLHRAAAAQIDDGTATTLLDAAAHATGADLPTPPPDGAPADHAQWWDALNTAEQERVLTEHPEWIGNLNGLPAAVRDQANRARIHDEILRVDRELAAATTRWQDAMKPIPLPAPGMDGLGAGPQQLLPHDRALLRAEVDRLQDQRDALAAVQTTTSKPGRQLLLLDVSTHAMPHAALAVGDLDTADHVAVFTPGFTTTVAGGLTGYTNDMQRVQDTALTELQRAGRGQETVAAVTWIGYDIPQWSTTTEADRSVLLDNAAEQGGPTLAGFVDGIHTSRAHTPAGDAHLTALGHSYGSVTTGFALQHATGVDDAVLFGSPGPSTDDVGDLRVPPGHLAVLEARKDAVADLGSFGGDPNQLDGVVNLSSSEHRAADGTVLRESTGHSDYLAPDTTSQHNIAATVAGLPDRRITGSNTGAGDWLRAAWDAT